MGYNNWAQDMCNVSEARFKQQVDALVSTGLAAAGYDTATLDDCWMQATRDAAGNIQTRRDLFPSGLKALGDYVHSKGLKFGLYGNAGPMTCSGKNYMGSYGHFDADMKTFASFGVDYVKMDGCFVPQNAGETLEQAYKRVYTETANAIANSGRQMVFSNSSPAYFSIPKELPAWYSVMDWSEDISQLWRTSWDMTPADAAGTSRWSGILRSYDYNKTLQRFNSKGHYNDPDFIIGGHNAGVTEGESQSQLSLWSMMAAPLIVSADLSTISTAWANMLTNKGMLAIDQDPLGKQGTVVSSDGTKEVMTRKLANGDFALALFNRGETKQTVSTSAAALGFTGNCTFTTNNVWTGAAGSTTGTFTSALAPHATTLLRVTPGAGCQQPQTPGQIMSVDEKLCFDNYGSKTTQSNRVQLFTCTGNANQSFTLGTDGTLKVQDRCIVSSGGPSSDIVISNCTGHPNQRWTHTKAGNLVNQDSGLCIDAFNGSLTSGTRLTVWTCGPNQLNQLWSVNNG